jgi:hypothetical protein
MKRIFFFALLFPPALMDLMLIALRPTSVSRYFIAGYIVAIIPAMVIAVLDEALQGHSAADRAGYGACAAFASAPVPLWFLGQGNAWLCVQAGCFAAVAAFICIIAFAKLSAPKRALLMLPSPDHFKDIPAQA